MADTLLDQDTIRKLEQLTLVTRRLATGKLKGERRSRRRGTSTDFADYRDYAPGDDLRFLDWKIYSRLERLFIKLFLEEEDLRVNVLLDTSASMGYGDPEKQRYARQVAAALGVVCLSRMDSLTVHAFGDGLAGTFGPRRGKGHELALLEFLSALPQTGRTDLNASLKALAAGGGGHRMVVVISDFYDFGGYDEALRRLFAANFEVLIIHTLSPQEIEPDLQGDLRLVDSEFAHTTDVSMGPSVLGIYRRTLSAFSEGLRKAVVNRGGCYLLTSTSVPFVRLVLDVLRRRGIVR